MEQFEDTFDASDDTQELVELKRDPADNTAVLDTSTLVDPVAVTLAEIVGRSTIDDLKVLAELIELRRSEEAERLRDEADEIVRQAREALALAEERAAELEGKAEVLDGPTISTVPTNGAADAPPRRAVRSVMRVPARVSENGLTEEPSSEDKPKSKRTRKTKAPGERVSAAGPAPTDKSVLGALKKAGEPVSIGTLAETLECDKSLLVPVLRALVSAGSVVQSGQRRGTKYEVA